MLALAPESGDVQRPSPKAKASMCPAQALVEAHVYEEEHSERTGRSVPESMAYRDSPSARCG